MTKNDQSAKQEKVDSHIQNEKKNPKSDRIWNKIDRSDCYNVIMIVLMIITLVGGSNCFGYAINFGDELSYQKSCQPLTQDCKNNINASEGNRVKLTGTIIADNYTNDVRILFLQPDGCSDNDRVCVMIDSNQRNGEEGDLVTVYGFLYGTHLASKPGYYVPLVIGKYINIKESKYQ